MDKDITLLRDLHNALVEIDQSIESGVFSYQMGYTRLVSAIAIACLDEKLRSKSKRS